MTFKSLLSLSSMGVVAAFFVSCAPLTPYQNSQAAPPAIAPTQEVANTVDAPQQKSIKKAKKKVSTTVKKTTKPVESAVGNATESANETVTGASDTVNSVSNSAPVAPKPTYRYALPIPGKEGFVFNPFTNNPVDVRGIPSGTLVRDPQDSNSDHKFRVP